MNFHYASDVAQQFVAAAEQCGRRPAFNLGGPIVAVAEVAAIIMAHRPGVTVTCTDDVLPFPSGCDDAGCAAMRPSSMPRRWKKEFAPPSKPRAPGNISVTSRCSTATATAVEHRRPLPGHRRHWP